MGIQWSQVHRRENRKTQGGVWPAQSHRAELIIPITPVVLGAESGRVECVPECRQPREPPGAPPTSAPTLPPVPLVTLSCFHFPTSLSVCTPDPPPLPLPLEVDELGSQGLGPMSRRGGDFLEGHTSSLKALSPSPRTELPKGFLPAQAPPLGPKENHRLLSAMPLLVRQGPRSSEGGSGMGLAQGHPQGRAQALLRLRWQPQLPG